MAKIRVFFPEIIVIWHFFAKRSQSCLNQDKNTPFKPLKLIPRSKLAKNRPKSGQNGQNKQFLPKIVVILFFFRQTHSTQSEVEIPWPKLAKNRSKWAKNGLNTHFLAFEPGYLDFLCQSHSIQSEHEQMHSF